MSSPIDSLKPLYCYPNAEFITGLGLGVALYKGAFTKKASPQLNMVAIFMAASTAFTVYLRYIEKSCGQG